jgi:hypothetical protein
VPISIPPSEASEDHENHPSTVIALAADCSLLLRGECTGSSAAGCTPKNFVVTLLAKRGSYARGAGRLPARSCPAWSTRGQSAAGGDGERLSWCSLPAGRHAPVSVDEPATGM